MTIRYLGKKNSESSSAELLSGQIYPVLALWVDIPSKTSTATVLHDDLRSAVQITAETFEVVDQSIPKMWEIAVTLDSVLMAPREWQSKAFWQGLVDGAANAVCDFDRVLPDLYKEVTGEPLRRSTVN